MSQDFDSPSPSIRFANSVLVMGIIGFLTIGCYALYRLSSPIYIPDEEAFTEAQFYIVATSLALIGAFLLFMSLRLGVTWSNRFVQPS